MFCAATALVALARILSACAMSADGLLLGVGALAPAALLVRLALQQVRVPAEVVLVELGAVGVQVEDLVDRRAQQVDVVADDDEPARVRLEVVAQPHDRVGVEVVGRLVEQQRVDAGEQDAGQLDAAALTTGERADRLAEHALVEPEVRRDPVRLALGRVPAGGGEPRLEPRVPRPSRPVARRRRPRWPSPPRSSRIARDDLVETARGEHPVHGERVEVARAGVLRQVADVAGADDLAAGGLASPPPASWSGWSCRRRCVRPDRSGRRPRCGTTTPRAARGRRRAARRPGR